MVDRDTVLILTGARDQTAAAVAHELQRHPVRVVAMDTGDFPLQLRLAAMLSESGWTGRLADHSGDGVELERLAGVYYRRPTRFRLPAGMSETDRVFATAEARHGLGGVLISLGAQWVNDPGRIAVAEYKPVQLAVAGRCGLRVPATLITNDRAAAAEFADRLGRPIVCKALSSIAFSEAGQTRIIFTTPVEVDQMTRAEVAATAHLLQAQVPKRHDVRVVMIAGTAFAVEIRARSEQAHLDWRLDYHALTYQVIEPPDDVVAGMRRVLDTFGLLFAAFDFGVDRDGIWWFYEVNPNGQWLWLAEATGLPIASALAAALTEGASG